METFAYKNALNRVHTAEKAAEQWKIDHHHAMDAYEAQDLVFEMISLADLLGVQLKRFEDIRADKGLSSNLIVAVHHWTALLECVERLFEFARKIADQAQQRGFTLDRIDDFMKSSDNIKETIHSIRQRWPLLNKERAAKSREEIASRRFQVIR